MFSLAINFLPAASVSADKYNLLFHFLIVTSIVSFVLCIGTGFIFIVKYRRKKEGELTAYIPHNYLVEFLSIFCTSVVVAIIFLWGWFDYYDFISPKLNEYEINVIGQQWSWQVQYAEGKTLLNEMYVPRGRPIKLILTSKDVTHDFFVPAFRVKQDAVPGQYTVLRFNANKTGDYDIFCAQYCGGAHSGMIGIVHVVEPDDFQKWMDGMYRAPATTASAVGEVPKLSMAERGHVLYQSKTCVTCHTVDGTRLIGPSFKGLYGSTVELNGGNTVLADENYIRESITDPMAKIVKGYPPQMPTFRGMVSDEEMNEIIAYIKTLK
jgi:cytochrome c oxidase subunit 2